MTMRHSAGGAGDVDEPERGQDAPGAADAGPAPIWKDADERPEGQSANMAGAEIAKAGAIPGAIAGASAVGPTGGIIGAAAGEKSVPAENEDRPRSSDEER